jgi:lipopolysaccharide/colanic/teichoic acid biosynthesis glycosyltransferase
LIRLFDIVLAIVALIVLFPLLFVIAIWVKIDSRGGIFYIQTRVGYKGRDFNLIKFRSMRVASDKLGLLTIGERDPRITNSGYFIRKYKIDELPQLLNVLIGNMSFVGPRPEVRKYVQLYNFEQLKVLNLKPGITDEASIAFRNENEILSKSSNPELTYIQEIMPVKIELNQRFIENPNLFNYLKIISKTICRIIYD